MKRLKKTELKKLSIDASTIRILSIDEQRQVAGGAPSLRSCDDQCINRTATCSCNAPGTC